MRLSRAWVLALLLGGATALAASQQFSPAGGQAELAILDVGNGMCGVLRTPSGRTVLLDAGSRTLRDCGRSVLVPFLRERLWRRPSAAFLSHDELDHFNALPALLPDEAPQRIFVNERFAEVPKPDGDERPRELLELLRRGGSRIESLRRGDSIELEEGLAVTCLWPPRNPAAWASLSANDSSFVLRLDCGGVRVLLPGDVRHLGQQLLLELPRGDLRAEVLVLPHHGSATPVLEDFLGAVDPRIVIRSSAFRREGAAKEIPSLAVHREFFATGDDGCVSVRLTSDGVRASAMRRP